MIKTRIETTDSLDVILRGAEKLYEAVSVTMGPRGQNVIFKKYGKRVGVTHDGVTVARLANIDDEAESVGADLLREAAGKLDQTTGDGPQPLYARVLTPTGFVAMGDVEEGMEVCGTDGSIQTVLGVYEKGDKEIYRISLADGRVVECCEDHLWTVTTKEGKRKTLTVQQMLKDGVKTPDGDFQRRKFFIQRNIVDFNEKTVDMPIDPYTLGVLLGDGSLSGSGTIELSLGFKKRHILDKLRLPEGVIPNTRDCEKYIRVKLPGRTMVAMLKKLGLYGTNSTTKFIPEAYLYSSVASRKALLQGLLDTDGHINQRGLFEFSTVSTQLANDFSDLAHGLGYDLNITLHTRANDPNSYSHRPIVRIVQLKGRKHGMAIDSIEATGETTPMRCIKVSNPDNLYITDGYVVTHNTTTVTVLAYHILKEAAKLIKAGENPMKVKLALDRAQQQVLDIIHSATTRDITEEQLISVASIAAGDKEVGQEVGGLMFKAGGHTPISLGFSDAAETTTEMIKGFKIDSGPANPYLMEGAGTSLVIDNPKIIVVDGTLRDKEDVVPILRVISALEPDERGFLLVVGDIAGDAMQLMVINRLKKFANLSIARVPAHINSHTEYLADIAISTGATVLTKNTGNTYMEPDISHFGSAERVIVEPRETIIVNGASIPEDLDSHKSALKEFSMKAKDGISRKFAEDRLMTLEQKVVSIMVGGQSETDAEEKHYRYEDAVGASRAALRGGVVPGGGTLLYAASEQVESPILKIALKAPMTKVLSNAGVDVPEGVAVGYGIDVMNPDDGLVSMTQRGILDPAESEIECVKTAISIAGLLITSGAIIVDINKQEQNEAQSQL